MNHKSEEYDQIGKDTLDVISEADRFIEWMYFTIKPYCSNKILEVGSGIGNITEFFLEDQFELLATDLRKNYCSYLNNRFRDYPSFAGAEQMNLVDPDFEKKFKDQFNQFNTVFALNVVEHIEDDTLAISNCKKLLKPKGRLIILVPSYQVLYNSFDEQLGHFRRYTINTLASLFENTNFDIIHKQYFNFVGIIGWFFSGRLLKIKQIPRNQMKLYNRLVPFIKLADRILFHSMGLSVIVVGEKKSDH